MPKPKQSRKSKMEEGWSMGFWLVPAFWLTVLVGASALMWLGLRGV